MMVGVGNLWKPALASTALVASALLLGACQEGEQGPEAAAGTPKATATPGVAATGTSRDKIPPVATPRGTATAAAPTAVATPAPTAISGAGEIAYFGPDGGDIWLVNADGSGQRGLTEGQCREAAGPFWSPRGDKIACASGAAGGAPVGKIAVFDLEGRTLAQAEAWPWSFAWSPDDRHFFYLIPEDETQEPGRRSLVIGDTESEATVGLGEVGEAVWSPDGSQLVYLKTAAKELAIYDMASGQTRTLEQGLQPLAWVLRNEALLVAANIQPQEFAQNYEANLLNLASGKMARVPELDDGTQFWLSPDGQTAAFLAGPADRAEGGAAMSILNLATRNVTAIEGAVIGYPSEFVPADHVAFSPDGAYLYWIDVVVGDEGPSGTAYRARSDGSELTQLGTVQGVVYSFSPDGTMMLYSDGNALWVARIDGSGVRSLAEGVRLSWPPAAWRPLPTP